MVLLLMVDFAREAGEERKPLQSACAFLAGALHNLRGSGDDCLHFTDWGPGHTASKWQYWDLNPVLLLSFPYSC